MQPAPIQNCGTVTQDACVKAIFDKLRCLLTTPGPIQVTLTQMIAVPVFSLAIPPVPIGAASSSITLTGTLCSVDCGSATFVNVSFAPAIPISPTAQVAVPLCAILAIITTAPNQALCPSTAQCQPALTAPAFAVEKQKKKHRRTATDAAY